jgi:hypothetical protein
MYHSSDSKSKIISQKGENAMTNESEVLVIIEEGTDVEGKVEISCCYTAFMMYF